MEIDNNLVKNAIRPTALGKKNWLFVGEANAGERAAIIYTLIESCRRRGIDPYTYLKDVLTRLPNMTNRQIPDVTPAAWAKARLPLYRKAASSSSEQIYLTLLLSFDAPSRGTRRVAYPRTGMATTKRAINDREFM